MATKKKKAKKAPKKLWVGKTTSVDETPVIEVKKPVVRVAKKATPKKVVAKKVVKVAEPKNEGAFIPLTVADGTKVTVTGGTQVVVKKEAPLEITLKSEPGRLIEVDVVDLDKPKAEAKTKTSPSLKRRYQAHLDYINGISKNSMSTKRYVSELASRVPCAVKSKDKDSAYSEAVGYLTKKIGD